MSVETTSTSNKFTIKVDNMTLDFIINESNSTMNVIYVEKSKFFCSHTFNKLSTTHDGAEILSKLTVGKFSEHLKNFATGSQNPNISFEFIYVPSTFMDAVMNGERNPQYDNYFTSKANFKIFMTVKDIVEESTKKYVSIFTEYFVNSNLLYGMIDNHTSHTEKLITEQKMIIQNLQAEIQELKTKFSELSTRIESNKK